MESKIKTLEKLIPIVSARRDAGKSTIVFTNGCFDLLHVGHIRYLQKAKKLGDLLIVGINSDSSVRALEKAQGRPIIPAEQRAEVLAALECVDFVVPFDEANPARLIEHLLPDILVKGGDWSPDRIIGRDVVVAHGGHVSSIPLVPDVSTTKIIERIQSHVPRTSNQEKRAPDKGPSATSRTEL